MVELVDHVRLGRAEASRECVELRGRQMLAAKHEHLAGEECALYFIECGIAQRCGEIDSTSLEAEPVG
jgi:hypothetical protein